MLKRLSLIAGLVGAGVLSATEPPPAMPPMPKPGPQHEWLRKMDGEWLAVVKDHMTPGAKDSAATWTCKEMGGFWELCDAKGEMMGQPFMGHEIMGYDMKKKKHTAVWVDSVGDYMMFMEGTATPDGKTTTLWGKAPGMDGKMASWKSVTEWTDDDHMSYKYWVMQGKKAVLMLEIAYTRKK